MLAIELVNARKSFGSTCALDNLSLSLPKSQITVVAGASGAGKSTLLRIIAGLESLDGGEILLGGTSANKRPPQSRGTAYLTQDAAMYPHQTLEKNLELSLRPLRLQVQDRKHRIQEAIELLQLQGLEKRLPSQLSGGQRQRAALARAIARRAEILLLDEPFSQLDPQLKVELREVIGQLSRRFSMNVIMVSHDALDTLSVADHIAILHQGNLLQYDTPETIYDWPTTRPAAELTSPLGVNWIPRTSLPHWPIPADCEWVGFRPETCTPVVKLASQSGSAFQMTAQVTTTRFIGQTRLLTCQMGPITLRATQPAQGPAVGAGEPIKLTIPANRVWLENATTQSLSILGLHAE